MQQKREVKISQTCSHPFHDWLVIQQFRQVQKTALLLQTFPNADTEVRVLTIALLRTNHILLPLSEAVAGKIPASQKASSWVRYMAYFSYHKTPALFLCFYLTVQGISQGSRRLQGSFVLLVTSQGSLTLRCYFTTAIQQ